jgi:hypothetical protein
LRRARRRRGAGARRAAGDVVRERRAGKEFAFYHCAADDLHGLAMRAGTRGRVACAAAIEIVFGLVY